MSAEGDSLSPNQLSQNLIPATSAWSRRTTVLAVLTAIAATWAIIATVVRASGPGLGSISVLVSFALAIAVGEALRVWLPGGREAAPVGTAAAVAFALTESATVPVGTLATAGASRPATAVIDPTINLAAGTVMAVVALATFVGIAPYLAAHRPPDVSAVMRRFLSVSLLIVAWRISLPGGHPLAETTASWPERWLVALLMAVVVVMALAFDALLAALLRVARGSRFRRVLWDELRVAAGLGGAIGATGVLVALAVEPVGLLALPFFLAPLLLTQLAFRRYAGVRQTYQQTIRSLSRLTELGGYTADGHARRVSGLAVAIGRQLGLGERALRDLEYAALLHDIGQLALAEPIPRGATVVAAPGEQRRIADLGAEVIRRAGVLDEVATIVERQVEPYRRRHQIDDRAVPLSSRIIKAANAYDDLLAGSTSAQSQREALERIHLGLAYEYDPRVVAALTGVLTRGA
ncbi:MAG: HD-GYP domain-containing protein [Angustibacter sp.]